MLIVAFATAELFASTTTPVILPRASCAYERMGRSKTVKAEAATKASGRLAFLQPVESIFISLTKQGVINRPARREACPHPGADFTRQVTSSLALQSAAGITASCFFEISANSSSDNVRVDL